MNRGKNMLQNNLPVNIKKIYEDNKTELENDFI